MYERRGATAFLVIAVEIVFIIIAIFAIVNVIVSKTKNEDKEEFGYNITIENSRQELGGLGLYDIEDIKFAIYDALWLNGNKTNEDAINVKVRSGSVVKRKFEKSGVREIRFLVDVDALQQTYWVNYLYSANKKYNANIPIEYRTMVYCPEGSQAMTNQECRDRFAGQAEDIIRGFDLE